MRGLYPIIDVDSLKALKMPILDFARSVLAAGPPLIQLRAKHLSARETLELLRALQPLCRAAKAALFANDRPDLAVLAGCDGVHIGQDDLPLSEVRRFAPTLKIGVSTHDFAQLDSALHERADYVAFGPVFSTRSKSKPEPLVGIDALARAAERSRTAGCTLVAIGGIDLESAPLIAQHGALGAVIGALLPPDGDVDGVTERARLLHVRLGGSV